MYTRDRSYNHAHQEGNQFISFQRQGLSEKIDDFHHYWIGGQPLLTPPTTASEPAFESDEEALGFLVLCSSRHYESRAPHQKIVLLTEASSMSRDSLVVAPCSSGKTNAIVASVVFQVMLHSLR